MDRIKNKTLTEKKTKTRAKSVAIDIMPIAPSLGDLQGLREEVHRIQESLHTRYLADDGALPWVIAYSGGKDSTLVLHFVFEMLLNLKPEQRQRQIQVVSNDTLVESPLLIDHLKKNLTQISKTAEEKKLPLKAFLTRPALDQTFWVNLIGKGYIPPTRNFRWCTDKMKIVPTNRHIEHICSLHGGAILLIGTRKLESQARKRSMEKRLVDADGLNQHDTIKNCKIATPISELSDDQVWMILLQSISHWGKHHRELITIYRNARGGECPTVLSKADAPSCGSTSPRFGCWTCTVVSKDRSLEGLVGAGYNIFETLVEFRNWIQELREVKENRMSMRRDGVSKVNPDGSYVQGPFKIEIRERILERLLETQKEAGRTLITEDELECIEDEWSKDKIKQRFADSFKERLMLKAAA